MQIYTACMVIIILDLNIFEAHCQAIQDNKNFRNYLKKTFAVLKNEKLSRNMRSLLNNLKQDDLRRKIKMRRKKQVLMSSNLKDNPLFILTEQQPVAQAQGLNNLNGLISNSLFGKNYDQSHTRSSSSNNGFDINAIDKTDAQIVGALYYPSSSSNSVDPNQATDASTEEPSDQPNLPNLNQIPASTSNDAPQQSGSYLNNDYMKSYLENIKMVPIYPVNANLPNEQPTESPVVVADNPKRCSTQDYESSQKEGLFGIFSEIYKNLKLNSIITTTSSEKNNDDCPSNSVNLLNPKYGTANEPIEETTDNNSNNQYRNILNPAVMGSITSCIKSIIEKQNKKLTKCNSNLPESYQNVLTPQLMSLILDSLANTINPKHPSVQNLITNNNLDQYISRSTSEKSLPEENYLDKLSRYDLTRQVENNNFHIDLNSLLNTPDKNKEFIYTNSPQPFQSKYELSKPSSGRVERSTTLKQKVLPKNIIPAKKNNWMHVIQPKLSIFSNLNFPKRCENSSGENDTNSKSIEKESFNTSSAIEEILKIVQEMRNKEKQLNEDVNCNILGSWSSMAGGMLINVTQSQDILDITLSEKSPPGKKGFLMDPGWIIKGVQPIPKTHLIILTGTNLNTKHVIVFIGECRVCGGSELVTGNWLIGRCSHNCQDQKASQDLLSDVWRREMLTKLFNDRLNAMSKLAGHKKGESDTSSHHITTVATTAVGSNDTSMTTENNISTCNTTESANSSSTDEVGSEQPSNGTTVAGMEENDKNQSSNATTCTEENGKKQPSNATTVAGMEENGQNQPANAVAVPSTEEVSQNETTANQKLDTSTCKTTSECSQTKQQKSETTCNATEEDLNFLFSSSSSNATTASGESSTSTDQGRKSILGNIECSNNSSQGVDSANKTTTTCDNQSTKSDTDKKSHTGNKMFTLCNYNNKAAAARTHHEKTKKTTTVKCTTTPLSTTCEPTTEESTSSPSTSCGETTKTNETSSNKCVVEIDVSTTTAKTKFLNKVIHIFKNKSKTTTEKC